MKKNRIIIPALSLLVGVTLAGSVSGTIAWYQYSTRANGLYVGTATGVNGNLQLSLDGGEWLTRLTKNDISSYLSANNIGQEIKPITSGDMCKDDALPTEFYANPIAGKDEYSKWQKAGANNYVTIPLELRFVQSGGTELNYVEKDVYLSDLYLAADAANGLVKKDISDAVRFHVSTNAGINRLISKNGGSIATNGKLDLDGDDNFDQAYSGNKYGFDDGDQLVDIIYGNGNQESYAAKVEDGILVKTNNEDFDLDELELNGVSKSIGKTPKNSSEHLKVNITIWVEGWQEFAGSPIWEKDYIDSRFDVGFEFATDID